MRKWICELWFAVIVLAAIGTACMGQEAVTRVTTDCHFFNACPNGVCQPGERIVSERIVSEVIVPTHCVVVSRSRPIVSSEPAIVSVAQQRAEVQARSGRIYHVGNVFWGGYEGVGFSTRSADDAIRNCCYWGRRQAFDIGVARGGSGWYACVRYR